MTTVMPAAASIGQQAHDLLAVGGVEIAGGLVGQDQLRGGDEGAGDGDALLLAAGELLRPVARAMPHADPLQRLGDAPLPLGGGTPR